MSSYGSLSPSGGNSPSFEHYDQPYYCAQMVQDSPMSSENQFWASEYTNDYEQFRNKTSFIGRHYGYEDMQHNQSGAHEVYHDIYAQNILGQNNGFTIGGQTQCVELNSTPGPPFVRVVKRRNTANKKERRRTQSINTAFTDLRDCIPNVPADTKLSKIKTLRLATSYISYLIRVLECDAEPAGGFRAELASTQARRSRSQQNCLVHSSSEKKSKGRTGWPQHVWALELKTEHEN